MERYLLGIVLFFLLNQSYGQENKTWDFTMPAGLVFNQSNTDFMNTTGIGIYLEPKFFYKEKLIFGFRLEPIALAYGISVLPGGCTNVHPRYLGMPSCREGSSYLLNNYFFTDYRLGRPKYGKKGGVIQLYAGFSLNVYSHSRYIITSREPGNWKDTKAWVTDLGPGLRFGALIGRIQMNLSFNLTGSQFQPFLGTGIGYEMIK